MYADVICFGSSNEPVGPRYYAMCASRRRHTQYFFSHEDILRTFRNNLCVHGDYPDVLSDLMGNYYYMAKFENKDDALIFAEYVRRKVGQPTRDPFKSRYITGEDRRILDEKNAETASDLTICDTNIDGA